VRKNIISPAVPDLHEAWEIIQRLSLEAESETVGYGGFHSADFSVSCKRESVE
jgi:hypothetical protein